ncbi:MAG: glycosidase [Planctomycetes bacterium]|nr:glycosidase [Planctomycetota bacterium]
MKLQRYSGNPILSPNPENEWESLVTTNPASWYDRQAKEVKLLYRAAGADSEHKIYLGLAASKDGYHFERLSDKPVFGPTNDGFDAGCVEDPRVVKIGDFYYMTYACRPFPPGQYWLSVDGVLNTPFDCPPEFPLNLRENRTSTGLAITKDFKSFIRAGRLTDPIVDDRDVILFPEKVNRKYIMIHRPMNWVGQEYGTDHPAMWISMGDDLLNFKNSRILIKARYNWEKKIGGNTPPIKTDYGWLTIYHAVGDDNYYRLGALLLDLENPAKVLHRTPDWLIQPEECYELEGYYNGVIFPCGKVVLDETLFVYYGAADKYVGLATCALPELLDHLLSCPA